MWSEVLLRVLKQMDFVATPGLFDPSEPVFEEYYASVKLRKPFQPYKMDSAAVAYENYLERLTEPPSPYVWTTEILHAVDNLYVEIVAPVMEELGRDDRPLWSNAMDRYFAGVRRVCREAWALTSASSPDPDEVMLTMNAPPKLDWVIKLAAAGEGYYLPLPTMTFTRTFISKLNNASTAIQWVSTLTCLPSTRTCGRLDTHMAARSCEQSDDRAVV